MQFGEVNSVCLSLQPLPGLHLWLVCQLSTPARSSRHSGSRLIERIFNRRSAKPVSRKTISSKFLYLPSMNRHLGKGP